MRLRVQPRVCGWAIIGTMALAARPPNSAADVRAGDRGAMQARALYVTRLATLDTALAALDIAAAAPTDAAAVWMAFRRARAAYKEVEWWLAATDTVATAALNGVPPEGVGDEDPAEEAIEVRASGDPLDQPVGLQAVEATLFPVVRPWAGDVVDAVVRRARAALRGSPSAAPDRWTDAAVFDAARLEIARVEGIGLASADAQRSGDGVRESASALEGMCEALDTYRSALDASSPATSATLTTQCHAAVAVLRDARDPSSLDRLAFITKQATPLARAVAAARVELGIPVTAERRAWRANAATVVERRAFDPWAFASPEEHGKTDTDVALGRTLFLDPRLGGASGHSCATCHQPARAFTDGLARRVGPPDALGRQRHTPTLYNVGLQVGAFVDLRVPTLEAQVRDVIANATEMAGVPLDTVAARYMRERAAKSLYGDSVLTGERIARAIAAYERTLVRLNSPFDRAVQGDTSAIPSAARRGFTVFMGKGRCGMCHFFPLFNGVAPPDFATTEVEVLGVPHTADTSRTVLDQDLGRYGVTHDVRDLYAFRVPTVRNAAVTAPYMHNGVYRTLAQVIDFYDRGGGSGLGIGPGNQTLSRDRLGPTTEQRRDLIAFLGSLTDTTTAR